MQLQACSVPLLTLFLTQLAENTTWLNAHVTAYNCSCYASTLLNSEPPRRGHMRHVCSHKRRREACFCASSEGAPKCDCFVQRLHKSWPLHDQQAPLPSSPCS